MNSKKYYIRSSVKLSLSCFLVLIFCLSSNAQKKELDSLNIITVKSFIPTIANAFKINDNPAYTDSTPRIPPQTYSIAPKPINTVFELAPIKPAKMVGEPLTHLYNSFVKAGFGNYTTPYGEIFYNSLRSKDYSYGIHYRHLSSDSKLKGYGYSGYSDNDINLYGKKFYKKQTLFADLDYSRNVVHYYGYDILANTLNNDAIYQRFSFISPALRLVSHYTDSTHYNYDLRLKYYNLMDFYKVNENNVLAEAIMKGYYDKQLITIGSSVDFYNTRSSVDTVNNTIIKISPSIAFAGNKWCVNVGVSAAGDFSKDTKFFFFPNIDFNFNVFDNIIIPYAGVGGGLDRNSYKVLSGINPFISPTAQLLNTDRKIDVYGGLRGTIDANASYNVKATYSKIDNMPFFVTDMSDLLKNKFSVVYDNVTYLNIHGELGYQKTEKIKFIAKGDYFHYETNLEKRAWYKPEMQITLSAHYNLRDKIVVKGDVFVIGKQLAKTFDSSGQLVIKELKGLADINLGVEYKYSRLFTLFVNFNNIAAVKYYRWNNYPTQRFLLMGGLAVTF
jgi:hypothetical protein